VRDVHPTHYGRICPSRRRKAEHRPHLVASTYADQRVRVHRDAYRQVAGTVSDDIIFLTALEEEQVVIAQATPRSTSAQVRGRLAEAAEREFKLVPPEEVHTSDVSPPARSVAAA
jgi:DNA-directed RNA polymerase beta subunit